MTFPAPGIYLDVPMDEYHADTTALSRGQLLEFIRSPYHYAKRRNKPSTASQEVYSALHCFVLEPDRFYDEHIVAEKIDGRTRDGKAQKEAIAASGKVFIDVDQFEAFKGVRMAVHSHATLGALLKQGHPEVTIVARDDVTGLLLRVRIDWLHYIDAGSSKVIALDLKATDNADPQHFGRVHVAKHLYHVQEAFYTRVMRLAGLDPQAFIFGAMEDSFPHAVSAVALDTAAQESSAQLVESKLLELAKCHEQGQFPAFGQGIHTVSLPSYLFNKD